MADTYDGWQYSVFNKLPKCKHGLQGECGHCDYERSRAESVDREWRRVQTDRERIAELERTVSQLQKKLAERSEK